MILPYPTPPLVSALCSTSLFRLHGGEVRRCESNDLIDANTPVSPLFPLWYICVLPSLLLWLMSPMKRHELPEYLLHQRLQIVINKGLRLILQGELSRITKLCNRHKGENKLFGNLTGRFACTRNKADFGCLGLRFRCEFSSEGFSIFVPTSLTGHLRLFPKSEYISNRVCKGRWRELEGFYGKIWAVSFRHRRVLSRWGGGQANSKGASSSRWGGRNRPLYLPLPNTRQGKTLIREH